MYSVKHNDYNRISTDAELVALLGESVLGYWLERIGPDSDKYIHTPEDEKFFKKLYAAMKKGDPMKMLPLVNEFLYDRGNGESYEVSGSPGAPTKKGDKELAAFKANLAKVKISALFD